MIRKPTQIYSTENKSTENNKLALSYKIKINNGSRLYFVVVEVWDLFKMLILEIGCSYLLHVLQAGLLQVESLIKKNWETINS